MGLDTSHDAWHGAYSAFDSFRKTICEAIGGTWTYLPDDVIEWYWGEGYSQETHPGLHALLCRSDCDGEIDPITCGLLADELEAILPQMDAQGMGWGHIERAGGYGGAARLFIEGCRLAAAQNEPLDFH